MLKNLLQNLSIICTLLIMFSTNIFAADIDVTSNIEYLQDGSYYETVLEEIPDFSRNSHSKTVKKTTNYKNAEGNIMWYITLKATFTYNNSSAKCTDVTGNVRSTNSHWEVSSKSFQKSGSTATGTTTVKQLMSGKVVKTTTKKISIHCSPTGKIS